MLGKREDMGGLCGGLEEGSGAQAPIVWNVGVTCGVRVQTEVNCSSPSTLPHHPLNRYGGEFLDFFFFLIAPRGTFFWELVFNCDVLPN